LHIHASPTTLYGIPNYDHFLLSQRQLLSAARIFFSLPVLQAQLLRLFDHLLFRSIQMLLISLQAKAR
jgi:hypothetical protein